MSDFYGKPITILNFTDTKEVEVNNEELEKIFNHKEVKDRKIVVLSLIGAFRGGKSFLLGYFLRFLYAHYPSMKNPKEVASPFQKDQNWMGDGDEPLKGFSWSSGTRRVTTGINMWNDVFLHTMDGTGEKIAIVVIDTQGLFDNVTTQDDNARIFGLGTLVSSVQVLNLSRLIQEDQLQYLRFATEFASFTGLSTEKKTTTKPFQKLIFLLRDWENPEEFEFGMTGGNYYLKDVLKVKPEHKSELKSVRQSISKSFDQINCCLLPHPGKVVATDKNYDGSWSLMEESFKKELKSLVEQLLLPKNLTLKKINSVELTCSEYKTHIESYFQLFQSSEILEIQNVYDATIESSMRTLLGRCICEYKTIRSNEKDLISEASVPVIHEKCKKIALDMFKNEKKMGSPEHEQTFGNELVKEIEILYDEWKKYQVDIIKKNREKMEAEKAKEQAEEQARKAEEERLKEEAAKKLAEEQARIAEKRRKKEEKAKKLAEEQARKAEEERLKEEAAKKLAEEQAIKAEKEKQEQIQMAKEAEKAQKQAEEQAHQAKRERENAEEATRRAEEAMRRAEEDKRRAEEASRRIVEQAQQGGGMKPEDMAILGVSAVGGPIGMLIGGAVVGIKKLFGG